MKGRKGYRPVYIYIYIYISIHILPKSDLGIIYKIQNSNNKYDAVYMVRYKLL